MTFARVLVMEVSNYREESVAIVEWHRTCPLLGRDRGNLIPFVIFLKAAW